MVDGSRLMGQTIAAPHIPQERSIGEQLISLRIFCRVLLDGGCC